MKRASSPASKMLLVSAGSIFYCTDAFAAPFLLTAELQTQTLVSKTTSDSHVFEHGTVGSVSGMLFAPNLPLQILSFSLKPSYSKGLLDSEHLQRVVSKGLSASLFGLGLQSDGFVSTLGVTASGLNPESPNITPLALTMLSWQYSQPWRFNLLGGWRPNEKQYGQFFLTGGFKWRGSDDLTVDFLFPLLLSAKWSEPESALKYELYLAGKAEPESGYHNDGNIPDAGTQVALKRQGFALGGKLKGKVEHLGWQLNGGVFLKRNLIVSEDFKVVREKSLPKGLFVEIAVKYPDADPKDNRSNEQIEEINKLSGEF
ncbi:MAG: hypothetical protein ACO3A4_11205 [Silvanigrellaceae bacterium]